MTFVLYSRRHLCDGSRNPPGDSAVLAALRHHPVMVPSQGKKSMGALAVVSQSRVSIVHIAVDL
jgi:hypothetical protein